jgi:hypothetical protein
VISAIPSGMISGMIYIYTYGKQVEMKPYLHQPLPGPGLIEKKLNHSSALQKACCHAGPYTRETQRMLPYTAQSFLNFLEFIHPVGGPTVERRVDVRLVCCDQNSSRFAMNFHTLIHPCSEDRPPNCDVPRPHWQLERRRTRPQGQLLRGGPQGLLTYDPS